MLGRGPGRGGLLSGDGCAALGDLGAAAESFGGLEGSCEFAQVQREGAGWRTRARCSAHGKSWTANVQLKVTGSTLVWSSERGRATYYVVPQR